MAVRFYVDADCLGLARILAGLRDDVTYPGDPGGMIRKRSRPPCLITTPDTADSVWIPRVAALGWGIITRDKAIQRKPAELAAVLRRSATSRRTWRSVTPSRRATQLMSTSCASVIVRPLSVHKDPWCSLMALPPPGVTVTLHQIN